MDTPVIPVKGAFGGQCNRARCQNHDVRYWNMQTHAYYCLDCAQFIDLEKAEVFDPQFFDWPLTPDKKDRRNTRHEERFRKSHPDFDTSDNT